MAAAVVDELATEFDPLVESPALATFSQFAVFLIC